MNDYLVMHFSVNVNKKEYKFIHTFNPYSINRDSSLYRDRPFLLQLQHRQYNSYNKKHISLPSSVKTRKDATTYANNILTKNYQGKYLYIPDLTQGYRVKQFYTTEVVITNNQKILYNKNTSKYKKIIEALGKSTLENMKPEQRIYIAYVRFFVQHKERALGDKFTEYCADRRAAFSMAWNDYMGDDDADRRESKQRGGKTRRNRCLRVKGANLKNKTRKRFV